MESGTLYLTQVWNMDQSLDRIFKKKTNKGAGLGRKVLRVVEEIEPGAVVLLLCLSPQVSCASRARHQLTQNSEDAEPEDKGGRNSYPVYLMEQQNLNLNQIPSPP